MPYYDNYDLGGYKYGTSLYWGDPFYRLFADGDADRTGWYDRLEIYWEPRLAERLKLRVEISAHFLQQGYVGSQQRVHLVFDIGSDRIRHKKHNIW